MPKRSECLGCPKRGSRQRRFRAPTGSPASPYGASRWSRSAVASKTKAFRIIRARASPRMPTRSCADRDRKFADSSLEGSGFELLVPGRESPGFPTHSSRSPRIRTVCRKTRRRRKPGSYRPSRHRYRAAMSVNFCVAGFEGRGTGISSFSFARLPARRAIPWSRGPRWVWGALVCVAG
jgi:hypothetical protein